MGAFGEDCLSPRFARASSAAAQFKASTEVYPEGAAQRGRLSLVTFLGGARKVTCCRATPGDINQSVHISKISKPVAMYRALHCRYLLLTFLDGCHMRRQNAVFLPVKTLLGIERSLTPIVLRQPLFQNRNGAFTLRIYFFFRIATPTSCIPATSLDTEFVNANLNRRNLGMILMNGTDTTGGSRSYMPRALPGSAAGRPCPACPYGDPAPKAASPA